MNLEVTKVANGYIVRELRPLPSATGIYNQEKDVHVAENFESLTALLKKLLETQPRTSGINGGSSST